MWPGPARGEVMGPSQCRGRASTRNPLWRGRSDGRFPYRARVEPASGEPPDPAGVKDLQGRDPASCTFFNPGEPEPVPRASPRTALPLVAPSGAP